MRRLCSLLAIAAMATAACGKSKEEKQAEQGAAQAAKGLEQLAKGLEAAAGGSGDNKPVEPVSFRDMIALFPDLEGWEKEKPTGEKMSSPVSFSTAEVRYTKGDSSIEIKIVDSGFNQMLVAPYAMFLQAGYEKETSDGYEKSVKVHDQPGWEKWSSESKHGELNSLAAKRFVVTIEGDGIADTKVLHDVAGKIDMNKLAALK
jgi:hypothetical protein